MVMREFFVLIWNLVVLRGRAIVPFHAAFFLDDARGRRRSPHGLLFNRSHFQSFLAPALEGNIPVGLQRSVGEVVALEFSDLLVDAVLTHPQPFCELDGFR